jgi:uroporphyrinogen-III synthase
MRVLVTRALEDGIRTVQELSKRGHEALVAPLSEVRFLDSQEMDLSAVCAIVATSSNGVCAFARRCPRRDLPVFTVGATTAATARAAGFVDVASAAGDALMLVELVGKSLDPGAGTLLHISGRNSTPGFREKLAEAGFDLRVWELYEIAYRAEFPEEIIDAFGRCAVDAVLVLSPESGGALVESLRRAGLAGKCRAIVACCISPAAAARAKEIAFGAVRVAQRPDLDSVLALLDLGPVRAHA